MQRGARARGAGSRRSVQGCGQCGPGRPPPPLAPGGWVDGTRLCAGSCGSKPPTPEGRLQLREPRGAQAAPGPGQTTAAFPNLLSPSPGDVASLHSACLQLNPRPEMKNRRLETSPSPRSASQPVVNDARIGTRAQGSSAQAPAAAAGGGCAFLAKQPDLLCSGNYEKNVCHELSRGRLSEGAWPGGPTQSCVAASSRRAAAKARTPPGRERAQPGLDSRLPPGPTRKPPPHDTPGRAAHLHPHATHLVPAPGAPCPLGPPVEEGPRPRPGAEEGMVCSAR
uniref:Uncharacterized protein n=1 Tax=Rangifer tarandus platyrhynchus TaxID=3082113 RepID=A0ACB0DQ64_RANTA|nr:unnamed protein product [Rangifer tarandus platyrhynchus]